jgi:hypothetical protein
MQKHEQKICAKCNATFECKVGSIHLCQCSTIQLTENERYFIQQQFADCLCINCLIHLKDEYSRTITAQN